MIHFAKVSILIPALLFIPSYSSATEIRMGKYEFDSGMMVSTMNAREVFVICENCTVRQPLSVTPSKSVFAVHAVEPPVSYDSMGSDATADRIRTADQTAGDYARECKDALCLLPIYFRFDHYDLSPYEMGQMDRLTSWVRSHVSTDFPKVKVIGHTCDAGGLEYNSRLSLQRAKSVASYLENSGFSVVEITGEGMKKLISGVKRFNRRVEIELIR